MGGIFISRMSLSVKVGKCLALLSLLIKVVLQNYEFMVWTYNWHVFANYELQGLMGFIFILPQFKNTHNINPMKNQANKILVTPF